MALTPTQIRDYPDTNYPGNNLIKAFSTLLAEVCERQDALQTTLDGVQTTLDGVQTTLDAHTALLTQIESNTTPA